MNCVDDHFRTNASLTGVLFLMLWLATLSVRAADPLVPVVPIERKLADSLMERVRFFSPFYDGLVDSYKAKLYIKGEIDIRRKNGLIRYLPSMFHPQKGERQYMIETYGDLHYTAPDIYDRKVTATVGTVKKFWTADGRLPDYFQAKIYGTTLIDDKLLSPLAPNAPRYYKYVVDSVMGPVHNRAYRIRFMPRYHSYQLVGGYMIVSDRVWSVREMRFSVRSEFFRCNVLLKMGEVGENDEFLPKYVELDGLFHFLGNIIEGHYMARLDYQEIVAHDAAVMERREKKKHPYDLTASYTLRTDTNAYLRDTAYFRSLRPIPLTAREQNIYDRFYMRGDTLAWPEKRRTTLNWGWVGDALIESNTVQLKNAGSVRIAPLLDPFKFGYSASNGLSYSHKMRYRGLFPGDRLLTVTPRVGYNFKQKEFYWRVNSDLEYLPVKRMGINLEVGNGNRIYSSSMLDELKSLPDSLFNFDKMNLRYYRDLYMTLRHRWEVVNGLTLELILAMHRRTNSHKEQLPQGVEQLPPALITRLPRVYNSFAPGVRLTWTPCQYYYMNGKRKVNLYSRYPTVSVLWERGVKGVLPRSGEYERVEVDYQHNIPLGLMRNFYYRVGWGAFTRQQDTYFVDFTNFKRSNLPTGWSDDIGGVFQLLDGRWYNSSREYLRANLTYEAPFLVLPHLGRLARHAINERLYLGALYVPHLKPYLEVGYGIGTHIFDFGFFGSFANWKYQEVGVKFTFELFNR